MVEWYISYLFLRMVLYAFGILDLLRKRILEIIRTSFGNLSFKFPYSDKMAQEKWVSQESYSRSFKQQLPFGLHQMKESCFKLIGVLSQPVEQERSNLSLLNMLSELTTLIVITDQY
jgi:hypothetical protein